VFLVVALKSLADKVDETFSEAEAGMDS